MRRRPDTVRVESAGAVFNRVESCEIVNDILGVSEAVMRVGDAASLRSLSGDIAPGAPFRVLVNGRPRFTGRTDINAGDISNNGAAIDITLRTRLADARYASATAGQQVEKISIRDLVLNAYKIIGLGAADFKFGEFADRDVMTGKASGAKDELDLDKITVQQARVQPPETVYEFVERHLKRHRAIHWDGPSGEVLVGRPDDAQMPLYRLQLVRGSRSRGNNIISCKPLRDWSEVASDVTVYGQTYGGDYTRSKIKAIELDDEVSLRAAQTGHFFRPVTLHQQLAKDIDAAKRAAKRGLSARNRRKAALEVVVDGWSYWNGNEQIPWANNTTADVELETEIGGVMGRWLVVRTAMRRDADEGDTTTLTLIGQGGWTL